MSDALRFEVQGVVPMPKGSKTAVVRNGRAVLLDGRRDGARKAYAAWVEAVSRACAADAPAVPLDGALAITAVFWLPRPKNETRAQRLRVWHSVKPDASKLLRAVEDPMTGVLIADDARISVVRVEKRYAPFGEPWRVGVGVTVKQIADTE